MDMKQLEEVDLDFLKQSLGLLAQSGVIRSGPEVDFGGPGWTRYRVGERPLSDPGLNPDPSEVEAVALENFIEAAQTYADTLLLSKHLQRQRIPVELEHFGDGCKNFPKNRKLRDFGQLQGHELLIDSHGVLVGWLDGKISECGVEGWTSSKDISPLGWHILYGADVDRPYEHISPSTARTIWSLEEVPVGIAFEALDAVNQPLSRQWVEEDSYVWLAVGSEDPIPDHRVRFPLRAWKCNPEG